MFFKFPTEPKYSTLYCVNDHRVIKTSETTLWFYLKHIRRDSQLNDSCDDRFMGVANVTHWNVRKLHNPHLISS